MVQYYAEIKIREALEAADNHPQKARRLLEEWCAHDMRLLAELTKPHMTGILAHGVDLVMRKIARGEKPASGKAEIHSHGDPDIDFGKELLKNFAMGKPAKFSQEEFSPPMARKKASQSHINAIYKLAKKRPE